jgi:hypothetical protein
MVPTVAAGFSEISQLRLGSQSRRPERRWCDTALAGRLGVPSAADLSESALRWDQHDVAHTDVQAGSESVDHCCGVGNDCMSGGPSTRPRHQ